YAPCCAARSAPRGALHGRVGARGGPRFEVERLVGSATEETREEAYAGFLLRVARAADPLGDVLHDLVDVLAAAGPGGLAADTAGGSSTHDGLLEGGGGSSGLRGCFLEEGCEGGVRGDAVPGHPREDRGHGAGVAEGGVGQARADGASE